MAAGPDRPVGPAQPGERAAIVGLTAAALALIWVFVDDLALRLVLVVLLLLVLPAIVVIALDRRI